MLNIVNTLQKHNKEVPDSFPIQINPFKYTIEGEALVIGKKKTIYLKENSRASFL